MIAYIVTGVALLILLYVSFKFGMIIREQLLKGDKIIINCSAVILSFSLLDSSFDVLNYLVGLLS